MHSVIFILQHFYLKKLITLLSNVHFYIDKFFEVFLGSLRRYNYLLVVFNFIVQVNIFNIKIKFESV